MNERLVLMLSQAQAYIAWTPRITQRAMAKDLPRLWMNGIRLVLSLLILTITFPRGG